MKEGESAPITLKAGSLWMEWIDGNLRSIRLGCHEVLRRIYVAVRDQNWGTIPAIISDVQFKNKANSFLLSYRTQHIQGDINFAWRTILSGDANGLVVITIDGEALSTFQSNRIGFCVLHPNRECAGKACIVEHCDGSIEESYFPYFISPTQPIFNIREISHEVIPGIRASVRMEGDVFEMEDQRNWGDASFKIYSRPLALPFPVEIRKGNKISQSITLNLSGNAKCIHSIPVLHTDLPIRLYPSNLQPLPFPNIGLSIAADQSPLSKNECDRIKALHLSWIRVNFAPDAIDSIDRLHHAWKEAEKLGLPLELAVQIGDEMEADVKKLQGALLKVRPAIDHILLTHRKSRIIPHSVSGFVRDNLREISPCAKFISGTDAYFAELNRNRSDVDGIDGLCFSINPQVHAYDDKSLMENLEALKDVIESAKVFSDGKGLYISPITLRPRYNPDALITESLDTHLGLPSLKDPRQMSLFGAAWTLASLKYLSESGVSGITFYETKGGQGLMGSIQGSIPRDQFLSISCGVYPIYHVFALAGEYAEGLIQPMSSDHPTKALALCLLGLRKDRWLVVNLTPDTIDALLTIPSSNASLKYLDERNIQDAVAHPEEWQGRRSESTQLLNAEIALELLPYAIAIVDSIKGEMNV
jgi:hypothetical protein